MSNKKSIHTDQGNRDIFICPVCNKSSGGSGPFVSDWAIACHVAGRARIGDRLHRSWALNNSNGLDFKAAIFKNAVYIEWAVVQARRERQKVIESAKDLETNKPYERIRQIETRLHEYLRQTLKTEFGPSEDGWWAKGVPLKVRMKCVDRREESTKRQDPYNFTDLIDLKSILDGNWKLFEVNFKRIAKQCKSKNEFLSNLGKLNEIRNMIMHPVRADAELTEQDTKFLEWLDTMTSEFASTE